MGDNFEQKPKSILIQVNEIVWLLMKAKEPVIVIDISCQEGGNWALC